MYINRNIEALIGRCASQFACLTIYGSRQVGKFTVINKMFENKYKHVSLDNLNELNLALNNPKLFLESYGWPLIIDEIQKAPKLLSYIKIVIDEQKLKWINSNEKSELMYVLTGSNQFELQESVAESLAGRTAIINMASLSNSEIERYTNCSLFNPEINVLKDKENNYKPKYKIRKQIFESIFKGGMPEYISKGMDRDLFFSSYIATYIEKDVKKKFL